MKRLKGTTGVLGAALLTLALAQAASAQVVIAAPTVSYYYTPSVVYSAPAPVPAVVSYYQPVTPVVVPAAPVVSYYAPAPTVFYPATVSRGLFGRTIVRTPFYKIKY